MSVGQLKRPEVAAQILERAGGDPERVRELVAGMDPDLAGALLESWRLYARPEQTAPDGDWSVWLLLAGRGSGKALALDTPLPTPSGWTTMGEVRVGDYLFDERGRPCVVTYVTPFQYDRPCYEVRFDDGTTIVADGDHRWSTWDKAARKAYGRSANPTRHPAVRTTDQIRATLRVGPRAETNHSIEVAGPLTLPDVDLPVDPYVLGYWLGDGSSAEASITVADEDAAQVLAWFTYAGYPVTGPVRRRYDDARCGTYPVGGAKPGHGPGGWVSRDGLFARLKALNVVKNKHVPAVYLRASERQRRDLLAGLMDSDGGWSGTQVEFCSTCRELADAVHELALSLGYKATLREGRATLYGKDCGPKYRVCWTPRDRVFRLTRKHARTRSGLAQGNVLRHRYVVDVTPVESVPVRCIQVSSPSSLFLCGRSMVPTHNTRASAEWVREQVEVHGGEARGALIGQTLEDVRLVMVEGESGLLRCLPPSMLVNGSVDDSWNRGPCELRLADGSRLKGFSSETPNRLRGPQHHFVWGDEPAEWRDARLGLAEDTTIANALIGCRLPPDPRVCLSGTPKGVKLIRELVADPRTAVTRMTTYDNLGNLASEYRARILDRYEGTRLGRQELMGELLDDAGGMFSRDWFAVTDVPLEGRMVRAWDLAATEPSDSNPDPDWSVGALVVWNPDVLVDGRRGAVQIRHVTRWRLGPGETQDRFVAQCREDGLPRVVMEQEPGSSGKGLVSAFGRAVAGVCRVEGVAPTGPKQARAEVWASMAEQGRVSVLAGDWVTGFLDEVAEFPLGGHDDQVDAVSLAVSTLVGRRGSGRRPRQPEARLPVGLGASAVLTR